MERTDGMILSCVLDPMEQINCCQITQPQTTFSQNGCICIHRCPFSGMLYWRAEVQPQHMVLFTECSPTHFVLCTNFTLHRDTWFIVDLSSALSGSCGCAFCGNCSTTWCWSSPVITEVLPQPRLQPQALFSNYYCARCCILPALFSSVTVSLFQVV